MNGKHRTWILDDGKSDEVRDLAAELGCHYVRRLSSNGAKAGNINHALSIAKGEYFAILDADFVPKEDFLVETLPFFVSEDVAFVQTPQVYGNLHTVIARGAGYMQTVFYRFIQPGRNHFNAAFCVGTNVVFRRQAVDDIGGMYTASKSEDVWTSLMLHERGWRSVYIPDELAVGDAPDTIEGFTKQQQRWATGGFEILMTHNPLSPRAGSRRTSGSCTSSRRRTTSPASHRRCCSCVPPLEIYFDLRPVTMDLGLGTWLLYYAGFYVMQIVLAFFTLGSFRWECLLLSTVSFPIYTRALFNVITGKDTKWHVTGGKAPRGLAVRLHGPAGPACSRSCCPPRSSAIWRDINHSQLTLATIWNITNTIILGAFIGAAFREPRRRRPAAERVTEATRRAGPAYGHRRPRVRPTALSGGAHGVATRARRHRAAPASLPATATQEVSS